MGMVYVDHLEKGCGNLRSPFGRLDPKPSYRVIAAAVAAQCDHWAYLADHSFGKDRDGWKVPSMDSRAAER